jgi:predicted DNA binding CopG/RHH family protein
MKKTTPEIGRYLDAEEKALIQAFEASGAPIKSELTTRRRREVEAMARAAMTDERAKISLRIPKRDLTRLKSRALQEGVPYQTLINALIHRYVSD